MEHFKKYNHLILIFVLGVNTGCIKFDDPPVLTGSESISYESPCTLHLVDNEYYTLTSSGAVSATYSLGSPVCTDTDVDCNPESGSFEIVLSEPVTESRTFRLNNPILEDGDALIKLRTSDFFTAPMYYSTSGVLYVNIQDDGRVIMEWCDIPFQSVSSNPLTLRTSGSVVCN